MGTPHFEVGTLNIHTRDQENTTNTATIRTGNFLSVGRTCSDMGRVGGECPVLEGKK